MKRHALGSLQVAAMLMSASYGIGFLFGSGQLALAHGMAGSLYGVATALGMLMLAAFAQRLWRSGVPVWSLFGSAYGSRAQQAVALLSLLWMAGVLAAQIVGGVAVAALLGLGGWPAYLIVLALIFGASRIDLRVASAVFALCLMASVAALVAALIANDGLPVYLAALPTFARDLASFGPSRVIAIVLAVGLLVCTGADYHQFVLSARRPWSALAGCLVAALALLFVGFLPAAVVVAMRGSSALSGLTESSQVVPLLLATVSSELGPGGGKLMLLALSAAALGSGAAILRAMESALASAQPGAAPRPRPELALLALGLGAALAARGQGIIDTMVAINVVYIASISVCFVALLCRIGMAPGRATAVMLAGFAASFAVYVAGWAGWVAEEADLASLLCGLGSSMLAALAAALIGPGSVLRRVARPRG